MKNNDCLFSDIQNLCNAVSDWLIKKSIIQLKPTRQYPVPVVTSCVITAEPVKKIRRKNKTHAKAKKTGSCKLRSKFETLRREIKADVRKQHACM